MAPPWTQAPADTPQGQQSFRGHLQALASRVRAAADDTTSGSAPVRCSDDGTWEFDVNTRGTMLTVRRSADRSWEVERNGTTLATLGAEAAPDAVERLAANAAAAAGTAAAMADFIHENSTKDASTETARPFAVLLGSVAERAGTGKPNDT